MGVDKPQDGQSAPLSKSVPIGPVDGVVAPCVFAVTPINPNLKTPRGHEIVKEIRAYMSGLFSSAGASSVSPLGAAVPVQLEGATAGLRSSFPARTSPSVGMQSPPAIPQSGPGSALSPDGAPGGSRPVSPVAVLGRNPAPHGADDLARLGRQPAPTLVSAAAADGPVSPAVRLASTAGLALPSDGLAEQVTPEALSVAPKELPVDACMSDDASSTSSRNSPGTVGTPALSPTRSSRLLWPLLGGAPGTRRRRMDLQ
jgi:hypothetical protein